MEVPDDETIPSVYELLLDIKPSDGCNAHEERILGEFHKFMRSRSAQRKVAMLDQRLNATDQINNLHGKYREVLEELNESEKLSGDRLTRVAIYPYLNRNDKNKFLYVLKASKNTIGGGQNHKEGSAIIHGSYGKRSPLIGNQVEGGNVYIRTNQLDQLGLVEVELSLHTGEYGALDYETVLTVINMIWNEMGCINRNINAITGACKKRINSVCFLVVDAIQLEYLHKGRARRKGISIVHPVLNSSWNPGVVANIRKVCPWLPLAPKSAIHYETQDELASRLSKEGIPHQPRGGTRSSFGSTRSSSTTSPNASFGSSDDDDKEDENETTSTDDHENAIDIRVSKIEDGIRIRRGNEQYLHLRSKQMKNRPPIFTSFFLCRSTIQEPTPRQFELDDCLKALDVDLVQHLLCSAKSFIELVDHLLDLLNCPEMLLDDFEPFDSREFDRESGQLYIPLKELCINVNHANVSHTERKATFFTYLWYAHEYKEEHCPNDKYVIVRRVKTKNYISTYECLSKDLDTWLSWMSGKLNSSTVRFGRVIESNTIECTLVSEIGICHNNTEEYYRLRDTTRLDLQHKRRGEELAQDDAKHRKQESVAVKKLFNFKR